MSLWFEHSPSWLQPRDSAERRITTQLLDYWIILCRDEPYARIELFDVEAVPGLARHAFVLDLQHDRDDPRVRYIGEELSADCGADAVGGRLSDVPQGSLLARVADHYRQVLDNQGPAEFAHDHTDAANQTVLYRAIMLPFTNDGETIDYVVGALGSKAVESAARPPAPEDPAPESSAPEDPAAADAPIRGARNLLALVEAEVVRRDGRSESVTDLSQSLRECQVLVREIDAAESRSHKALYAALERVYAFQFQAEADPAAFEQLLADAGLRAQARAPFTPIVKLVFGAEYDKTRLSEYAAALSYAKRRGQSAAGFRDFIEVEAGGLKGCIRAERLARRAARPGGTDSTQQAKDLLRGTEALGLITDLAGGAEEFVLVLGRRAADHRGVIEVLRVLDDSPSLVDTAVRRIARAVKRQKSGRKEPTGPRRRKPKAGPSQEPSRHKQKLTK